MSTQLRPRPLFPESLPPSTDAANYIIRLPLVTIHMGGKRVTADRISEEEDDGHNEVTTRKAGVTD